MKLMNAGRPDLYLFGEKIELPWCETNELMYWLWELGSWVDCEEEELDAVFCELFRRAGYEDPESEIEDFEEWTCEQCFDLFLDKFGFPRWYAVMKDDEDSDWGCGSISLERAKEKLQQYKEIYGDTAKISIIENGLCVGEMRG